MKKGLLPHLSPIFCCRMADPLPVPSKMATYWGNRAGRSAGVEDWGVSVEGVAEVRGGCAEGGAREVVVMEAG